ncbi:hypothetical protein [Pseudonocardia acaciae]|uniref:hypothetical protein n=1 Tax=Pseudonocardia acaciae TaxID=551276 RepID=UPI00048CF2A4|nr:hypothetical protein [Pseudonocardia acaciae]
MSEHGRDAKQPSPFTRPVEAAAGLLGGIEGFVGAASPRTRRMAVYAGTGLLGLVGVVEWPIAAAVAAVAWLTQDHEPPRATEAPAPAKKPETARRAKKPASAGSTGGRSSR